MWKVMEKPIIDKLESIYSERVVFIQLKEAYNPEAITEFEIKGFPEMYLFYGKAGSDYLYSVFEGFKDEAFLNKVFLKVLSEEIYNQDEIDQLYESTVDFPIMKVVASQNVLTNVNMN